MSAEPEKAPPERTLDFDPSRPLQSFGRTVVGVLLSPADFFGRVRRSGGYLPPFLFLTVCLAVHTGAVRLVREDVALKAAHVVLGLLLPFVTSAILHVVMTRLFRAKGTYQGAFRVNAYAAAVNLASWIPMAGMLMELYRVYLLSVGLGAVYSTRPMRAFGAIAVTLLVYIAAAGAAKQVGFSLS